MGSCRVLGVTRHPCAMTVLRTCMHSILLFAGVFGPRWPRSTLTDIHSRNLMAGSPALSSRKAYRTVFSTCESLKKPSCSFLPRIPLKVVPPPLMGCCRKKLPDINYTRPVSSLLSLLPAFPLKLQCLQPYPLPWMEPKSAKGHAGMKCEQACK